MKRLLLPIALTTALALGNTAMAQTYNLEEGQSRLIKTNQKIDTIFLSNPTVADYKIIGDNSIMLFARSEGHSDLTLFNAEGNVINSDEINVNSVLNILDTANKQIKVQFPDSKLSVRKVGKAYVIEGVAKSQIEQEDVVRLVGEAAGAKRTEEVVKVNKKAVPFLTHYTYENVIDNSTVLHPVQINLKLSVVEVNKEFTEEVGINWNTDGFNFNGAQGTFGFKQNVTGAGVAGSISLPNFSMQGFVKALNDSSNGRVLAEPNLSVMSGNAGSILIGGEVPIQTLGANNTPVVNYKEFGIGLNVGAKLLRNNSVRVYLDQEVSNVAPVKGSNTYVFTTRRSNNTFELKDGESFVIGGLYKQEDIDGLQKVPFLGDIPVLGAFFRNAKTDQSKKELIVVATVQLTQATDNPDSIIYPEYKATGTLERFFNVSAFKDVYYRTLVHNFMKNGGFIE